MGDLSVLVAVVDTGIYYMHPDLSAHYVPLGYDWVNMDSDPEDDHGHGTHCAGIIAAVSNNGEGIAGLAQVRVMAEKVLDSGGSGYWDWVANGIINATDCGADIISMSLGGYGYSQLVHDAVKYAYDSGVLLIAAAANDNTNMKSYPAAYDEVVAVAATDQNDAKASFSNWGDWIELAAPGVSIISTVPSGYESWSGTSMACPHVSGVAALAWSAYPSKTRDWLRLWLRYTADDLGDPGFDVYYGYGRINARKAVEQVPLAHELIAYEWETPPYLEPGASGTVNATILNFGENDETDVTVQLLANETVVDAALVSFIASGTATTVSLTWNPTVEGLYNVTLYVVPVPGETSVDNNVLRKYLYVGFPIKAVVLHSAGNIYAEIITNWQALNTEWHLFGSEMVYIDYTTLNKEDITYADIAATKADVLIISCAYDPSAGWQFTDSEIEAIKDYTHEGHGLIATAGTLYSGVPNNNKLASLFGLKEIVSWVTASTDLLHLSNASHPIFADVPNPLVFPPVTTALPSDGQWDSNELAGGKYQALGHYKESAIVTYRGLVYISPWLEIIPPYYHHHLQLLYNAIIWSRYIKPQHELAVSLEAPEHLEPGKSVLLNATVANLGLKNETNVVFFMSINGTTVSFITIPELHAGASYTINYFWTPTRGLYNVTACAPPLPGEELTFNNVDSVMTSVYNWVSTFVTDDNWPIPPDGDLDYYMYNTDPKHPIEWMHWYDSSPVIVRATLEINVWDVDLPDEVDEVYFNGLYLGRLEGQESQWTVNEFTVPSSYVQFGFNIVEVYVDKNNVGWWGMAVDWAILTVEYLLPDHELSVTLDAPEFLMPGTPIMLNATVHNIGLNDETDVELQLLIDDVMVDSVFVPELLAGTSYTLGHLWTPVTEGTYNITAYAPPVENEIFLTNNKATIFAEVMQSLIHPIEGQYANYTMYAIGPSILQGTSEGSWNFTYLHYISPHLINITMQMTDQYNNTSIGWMIVNVFTRMVEKDSGVYWAGMWYPGWIETNVTMGSTINLLWGIAPIVDNEVLYVNGRFIDCWEAQLEYYDIQYSFWYDKASGLWIGMKVEGPYSNPYLILVATNIPIGFTYEHDLAVALEAPEILFGSSAVLNASVYNTGLSDEANIMLQLTINGDIVASEVISELASNEFYTLSYSWIPAAEETYNITAYASPVLGEELTSNNVATKMVTVQYVTTIVFVDPAVTAAMLGQYFTISINITGVTNLAGWQLNLTFDPAIVNVNKIFLPPGHIFEGLDPITPTPWIDNSAGDVMWACAIGPSAPMNHFDGSGIMCQIEFAAVGLGKSFLHIDREGVWRTILIDSDINDIPFTPLDGVANVVTYQPGHDVAIIEVTPSVTKAYAGQVVNITVIAKNEGEFSETFTVTAYYDTTSIETKTVTNLAPGANVTLTFSWNTKGVQSAMNYTISAEASTVPGETDTADNKLTDGTVRIKLMGDINDDGKVDIKDLTLLIKAFGSYPSHPRWNPDADLNGDGKVDIKDLIKLLKNFGKTP
jgi:subtilisin family serine protease